MPRSVAVRFLAPRRRARLTRMLQIHIVAGLLAILAGFVALFSRKGQRLHRRSGRVFVAAMLVMLGTAAIMAIFFVDERANGIAALLTIYLVATSLLTVTRRVDEVRGITTGLAVVAFVLGAWGFVHGTGGVVLALVGFGCGIADLRLLAQGSISGARRLTRHLWRMTIALLIATGSFFLGQAEVLPVPAQNFALLSLPVLAVLLALIYWLVRLRTNTKRAIHGT